MECLHAIEKDIQNPLRTPEEYALGLQKVCQVKSKLAFLQKRTPKEISLFGSKLFHR